MRIVFGIRAIVVAIVILMVLASSLVWGNIVVHRDYSTLSRQSSEIELLRSEVMTLFTELVSLNKTRSLNQLEKKFDEIGTVIQTARKIGRDSEEKYFRAFDARLQSSRNFVQTVRRIRSESGQGVKTNTFEQIAAQFFINNMLLSRTLNTAKAHWSSEMISSFDRIVLLLAGFSLLLVSVIGVLVYYMQKAVINPLKILTEATHSLERNDLSYRISPFSHHNELALLAGSFNTMAKSLEENREILQEEIHERTEIQKMLHKQKGELERSNEDLEQFAYIASHDLQEPLRIVTSYLQLLQRRQKDKLDDDANRFIDSAVKGAERMRALIRSLLDYSRVKTQAEPFVLFDLNETMQNVVENLAITIKEKDATVEYESLPEVVADRSQIDSLLQNLVSNGLKFTSEAPPVIKVSAARANSHWTIAVSDNGIGIEDKYQDQIFGIFQRLHSRSEYEGTGIGLAICRRIVERHGGTIWLESRLGQGTTFFFTLPFREEDGHE